MVVKKMALNSVFFFSCIFFDVIKKAYLTCFHVFVNFSLFRVNANECVGVYVCFQTADIQRNEKV